MDSTDRRLVSDGPGVAVRFINRPDATPLTTIIEQKSIATLRSAVNGIAATRVNRWAEAPEQKQSGGGHAGRRQAALTIDEATLRELHEIIDSQRPPDQRVSSGSGTGYVNDVEHPARPISPPQSPPIRAQTPCGLPRWPGDLPTSFGAPHRRVSRVRSFGYALRHFFRGPRGGEFARAWGKYVWSDRCRTNVACTCLTLEAWANPLIYQSLEDETPAIRPQCAGCMKCSSGGNGPTPARPTAVPGSHSGRPRAADMGRAILRAGISSSPTCMSR